MKSPCSTQDMFLLWHVGAASMFSVISRLWFGAFQKFLIWPFQALRCWYSLALSDCSVNYDFKKNTCFSVGCCGMVRDGAGMFGFLQETKVFHNTSYSQFPRSCSPRRQHGVPRILFCDTFPFWFSQWFCLHCSTQDWMRGNQCFHVPVFAPEIPHTAA